MHFFFSGPRIFGIRPGIVLGPRDFRPLIRAAPIQGSFVYVIQGAPGLVKIGVTTDPRTRLANLQTGSPYPLEFVAIAATPGDGYDIEATAHLALGLYQVSGEWFRISPRAAVEELARAARRLGQPLLSVSPEQVDTILAIARAAPQGAPARSGRLSRIILWTLVGVLACLGLLAAIGH